MINPLVRNLCPRVDSLHVTTYPICAQVEMTWFGLEKGFNNLAKSSRVTRFKSGF